MTDKPWNYKPHPKGVSWQNCPYRMTGCTACVDETWDQRERGPILNFVGSLEMTEREYLLAAHPILAANYQDQIERAQEAAHVRAVFRKGLKSWKK